MALPLAIAAVLLVFESGLVGRLDRTGDGPTRRPHYVRLGLFTLVGAVFIGPAFSEPICPHGIRIQAAFSPIISGGIFGAVAEYLVRLVRGD
jgi:hypothetical protein